MVDIVVIGAGHAGCEAALSSARLNKSTVVLASNLDTVAFLACNPSIGGTAKGQIVKEIDALGGQMGINADKALLQLRMLSRSKGPAVYSPRAQVDKYKYHNSMKSTLENTPNVKLRQGEVIKITKAENCFLVYTAQGLEYCCKAVIIATGVYLNSKIIIGEYTKNIGPNGFASTNLTDSLKDLGFNIRRFKTGTPARINSRSVNFNEMEEQKGEAMSPLSFMDNESVFDQTSCYLTYTNEKTHKVIMDNLSRAPMYSGVIKGIGPRYCPSIEDKVNRFKDKNRHQLFLEPEGRDTNEYYVQGVSTSMPVEIQYEIYRSIKGLENVEIMRDAYAIEYDCIDPTQLYPTLMYKNIEGVFCAGQINGTSGYEEAAAQGLVAGINASRFIDGAEPLVLSRNQSYIGVLIDDITTKGTNEPYRMMTSRAEYRLYLRQDNADLRLTQIGRDIGLVSDERYNQLLAKQEEIKSVLKIVEQQMTVSKFKELFEEKQQPLPNSKLSFAGMLRRGNITFKDINRYFDEFKEFSNVALEQVEIDVKYEGYLSKQQIQINQAKKIEQRLLPKDLDYLSISGLRIEAKQKLNNIKPLTLLQASGISGVSPADINVLMIYLACMTTKEKDGTTDS